MKEPRYRGVTVRGWNITTSIFGLTPRTGGQANNINNNVAMVLVMNFLNALNEYYVSQFKFGIIVVNT